MACRLKPKWKRAGRKGKVRQRSFEIVSAIRVRYVGPTRKIQAPGHFRPLNDPYLTMSHDYEATIAARFFRFHGERLCLPRAKPVTGALLTHALAERK